MRKVKKLSKPLPDLPSIDEEHNEQEDEEIKVDERLIKNLIKNTQDFLEGMQIMKPHQMIKPPLYQIESYWN